MTSTENTDNQEVWRNRLKKIMREKGVTVTHLARQVGITQPAMSLKLNGDRGTDTDEIMTITDYLGVSVGALFDEIGVESTEERELIMTFRRLSGRNRKIAIKLLDALSDSDITK